MKKLFLLFGICSAFTASAQKDLFNAETYLQKKPEQNKWMKIWPLQSFQGRQQNTLITPPLPTAKLSQLLPDGSRVFTLPVDNMPCVSPDMTRFRNMPNADNDIRQFIFRQRSHGQIPNPAPPFILITEK
ncbi:MAG: hypothetical protein ACT4OJ_12575 [Bacteroidota bacterium]